MSWHPDVPDLPISKPKKIEMLEKMDPRMLDSMPSMEIQELVEGAALSVAETYHKEIKDANYEGCLEIVSVALTITGAGIGGRAGTAMTSSSEATAKEACRLMFPAHV
jgi:hypothetical protein